MRFLQQYRLVNRKEHGVSVIEMVVGLIVVIPLMIFLIDVMLITLGVQVNDHAAREAVRLAASGDPSQAQSRAQAVIDRLNTNSAGYVSNVTLKSLTFNPTTLLATEASLIPYGGVIQGSVTVITQVTITPIALSYVYVGPLNFQSSQTCPITYDVPNTAGGQPVPP
jgi:Flp pilus assembly protein TadG